MAPRRIGWYGDDFTGATDTLANLAEAGLAALLFLGIPDAAHLAAAGPLDAIGIAGAARAMAPAAMAEELAPVGAFFADLGVDVLHYKLCSTFDSGPQIGNIATAIATLRPHYPATLLPILGGQPNLGRYCLFGTLFAAAGAGGAVHRIDRHPTMASHPVTPMREADLIRHLGAQGLDRVGLLDYRAVAAEDAGAVLDALLAAHPAAVLMDVAREADLAVIGRLVWQHAARARLLAVGASSVARALAMAWPGGVQARRPAAQPALAGPVLALAGSLSPISRAQVAGAEGYRRYDADPARLAEDGGGLADLAEQIAAELARGRNVLVQTALPDGVALPPTDAARLTARLAMAILARIVPGMLAIAGGDTSSHAVQALDFWALAHAGTAAQGVARCVGRSEDARLDGLAIVLKGGQMGPPDLFARLAGGGLPSA